MNYDELQQGIKENLPIPPREELWEAIEKGNLTKYTPKQIEKGMLQERNGRNLYHEAALKGQLDLIPKEFLTEENLLQPDYDRWTCLHHAAQNGQLNLIPKDLLTEKNLLQPERFNRNCLHLAAKHGHLDQIPKKLLTEENLLKTNGRGWTCLQHAARAGQLDQIPQELLTKKNLLQSDHEGQTCFHIAAHYGHLDQIPPLSHQTLRELKTHFETQDDSKHKHSILALLEEHIVPLRRAELQGSLRSCDHPSL